MADSVTPEQMRTWSDLVRLISQVTRKVGLAYRRLAWAIQNKPMTDEEKFALRLAEKHVSEGRLDLAEEDLNWLGRRLEGAHSPNFPLAG